MPKLSESEQQQKIRELERENAELRCAYDILKDTLGFFAKYRKKQRHVKGICLFVLERKDIYTVKEMCRVLKIS